jgi:spore maturation protein CgeB
VRILLPIPRYDYGKPDWGDSFEYTALYGSLSAMGHDTHLFDTLETGRRDPVATGRDLLARAADIRPDLVIMMLMEEEVPLGAIRKLGESATTVNWFADDAWRFRSFSRHVAPAFSWALTTSRKALDRYRRIDGVRALFAPWAFNPAIFKRSSEPMQHDVSFIGQRHGVRADLIEKLRADGLDVFVRGAHWPGGRVTFPELATAFATSRINLNFLASSAGPVRRAGLKFRGSYRLDQMLLRAVPPPLQMKARLVEIPASGGFQITDALPEAEEMFVPGKEVVTTSSFGELREMIHHYLDHEEDRAAIALRGFERAHAEHTFAHRFADLFGQMGLA